jgi:hypothetical protein
MIVWLSAIYTGKENSGSFDLYPIAGTMPVKYGDWYLLRNAVIHKQIRSDTGSTDRNEPDVSYIK